MKKNKTVVFKKSGSNLLDGPDSKPDESVVDEAASPNPEKGASGSI